ncbi:MAG: sulfotransferase domain-containing protein [Anaerolineales bacterium]|nr:sulfotransferase domain-containing protein [Anaerolineales bacterium]
MDIQYSSPLPSFFIIGAAKSGTTTLHHLLKQHPDIFMPTPKEPHFFGSAERYLLGLQWYSDNFYKGSEKYQLRGDASPSSLRHSLMAAPRIKKHIGPNAKFIAIFRNPIDRAHSAYWHQRRETLVDLSFDEAVKAEIAELAAGPQTKNKSNNVISGGNYASNLKPFFENFERKSFLFFLHEDLIQDAQGTAQKMFSFLGVSPDFKVVPEERNTASYPRFLALQKFLYQPSGVLHKLVKPFTHKLSVKGRHFFKGKLSGLNLRPYRYPKMAPETREFLKTYYGDEVKQLGSIMGRDLSFWA